MRIDTRRTGALLAGLAMAAGIAYFLVSDSDANQAPGGRLPGDSSVSPTPTESPSPTTEPPPELNNTGNDFEAIWRSIESFRVWLARHPQASLLNRIYERDCPCYPKGRRLLKRLVDKGWHYDDAGTEVISVNLVDRPAVGTVLLRVVDEHGSQIVVDDQGNIVRRGTGWEPTRWIFTLVKGEDGRWRVRHIAREGTAS
jgi:hypothetical protein